MLGPYLSERSRVLSAHREGIYSRLSVEQGLQNHHSEEMSKPEWIAAQTEDYLDLQETGDKLELLLRNIGGQTTAITLDHLRHVGGFKAVVQIAASVEKSLDILISNQDDAKIATIKPPDVECGSHASKCLEGTRQDILATINAWAIDIDAPNILWINGYPGVGKSAIATSIVEKWRPSGRLGSTFFFRREVADTMTPHALWRTVAYDLGRRYPAIRKHLVALLAENETVPTTSDVNKLFSELIYNPLLVSGDIPMERSPIIVIDALDECGGLDGRYSDHRKGLIQTLKCWSSLPSRFKLVITSRRESDIEQMFSKTPHQSLPVLAGQIASSQPSEDIRLFLRYEIRQIVSQYPSMSLDWPGESAIGSLTDLASGLFIYVKTVLKMLERGELESTLKRVLSGAGSIASLYRSILNISFPNPSDEYTHDFRSILGAIIFTKTPLNIGSLEHLLSVKPSVMGYICNGLHSVLDFGETLRIYHQSFVDFLLDPDECPASFLIDRQRENGTLTMACLQIMKSHLHFNICDLESSYTRIQDVQDLDLRVKTHISSYLSYSSCHWAGHLVEAGFDDTLYEALEFFLNNQFLFWLEVLSLIKRKSGQNATLAMDMQKFVAVFASVIAQSVPHIYLSALPFAPRRLAVSRKYMASYPQTLSILHERYTNWPTIQSVINGHTSPVISVSFSPDGTRIVSGSVDKTVRVWDAETGETVMELLEGHSGPVNSVSFSLDGTCIVSGSDDNTIRVWDADTGEAMIGPLEGHTGGVWSVSFSPDGTRIVSGSSDKTIRVWNIETGETVIGPLKGHTDPVLSVSFSPDGTRVVSGSDDETLRIWDAETGNMATGPIRGHNSWHTGRLWILGQHHSSLGCQDRRYSDGPLEGHRSPISSLSFSPDGTRIVSGSSDQTIRVWDAETGDTVMGPLEGHTSSVTSVSFSSDGTRVVSGSWDKNIRVWDAEIDDTAMEPLESHTSLVTSLSSLSDGTRIVTGSYDRTIRLQDSDIGDIVMGPLEGHANFVSSVSFSPDGTRIVSGSWDKTIRVWDTETGNMVMEPLGGHTHWVNSVLFSPDGTRIVSCSGDKTIRVWDAETGETVMGPLEGHDQAVWSVSLSSDGTRIASGSSDMTIRVWDTETGKPTIGPLRGHTDSVWSVSFSPDGRRIVSSSEDKTIRIWNTMTGQTVMGPLNGHISWINSVSFSPDGTRIVSCSGDKTIRVWDAETGETVTRILEDYTSRVNSVSFSPDGARIVSGSPDKTIRVWDAKTGETVMGPLEGSHFIGFIRLILAGRHTDRLWLPG
ncbi:hypothetical protein M408DRAFT_22388 [Serendipita vermifera MAFF 305830]|uniref:NACHT domain-containing protein n=1 Tax=Serendipita vermifera MAFF 305830 TaxID=933852 RepID=A0A0C3BEQ4_SERVB|nr:hypothetical protein M408DRAFT_22388 [Serendipita vermifera MAFF 305830]